MELTLVGAFVIGLGLLFSITSRRRLTQSIIFFASFSGTAVVNVGEYGMAPDAVLLPLLLLTSVLSGRVVMPARLSRDHLIVGFLILVFTAIAGLSSLFNEAVHGVVSLQVTQTAYLLFGICLTLVMSIELADAEWIEDGLIALRAAATFISLWGLFQAACFYSGIEYPAFLFNNSASHFADMFDQRAADGIVRIASVATEPSFMATSLMIFGSFGATVIALDPLHRTAGWIVPVALTLVTVALSTSSTGYFGLMVLGLLLMRRRPMFAVAVFGCLAVIGGIWLASVPAAREAIYNMTLGKFTNGTYGERSATLGPAIELFARQPWFGFGWGADFSYSIITLMLANVGLLGSAAFVIAIAATLMASATARRRFGASDSNLAAYAEAAETAVLVYLAECAVSGFKYVVADFWCLWAFALAIPSCLVCLAENLRQPVRNLGTWRPRSLAGDA